MEDSKKPDTIEENDGEDFCHHYTDSITIPSGHLRIASAAGHQASVGQSAGHTNRMTLLGKKFNCWSSDRK